MRPRFIAALYFEGRIFCIEEYGDVYEFCPRLTQWTMLASSPWPRPDGGMVEWTTQANPRQW